MQAFSRLRKCEGNKTLQTPNAVTKKVFALSKRQNKSNLTYYMLNMNLFDNMDCSAFDIPIPAITDLQNQSSPAGNYYLLRITSNKVSLGNAGPCSASLFGKQYLVIRLNVSNISDVFIVSSHRV